MAVYDGLGRRLLTANQPITNNAPSGSATFITSTYDPEVEFLEIGVAVNGAKAWKVYGIDANERYGGLQGTGGLEATILDSSGTATGVLNDRFGNGIATISGGSITWNPVHVGAYGPLPGFTALPLTNITQLASAVAWRGRYIDPTGFYGIWDRPYDPVSGRWLSPDPLGQAATMSLYDMGGDPLNRFDPDGRCPLDYTSNPNGAFDPWQNYVNTGKLNYGLNPADPNWSLANFGRGFAVNGYWNSLVNSLEMMTGVGEAAQAYGILSSDHPLDAFGQQLAAPYYGIKNIPNLFKTDAGQGQLAFGGSLFLFSGGLMAADSALSPLSDMRMSPLGNWTSVTANQLGLATETTAPNAYSVAFSTQLTPESYPGLSRAAHFQEANESLLQAMEGDTNFAQSMKNLGVSLERTPTDLAPRQSPQGWTWHHADSLGEMQLVPQAQHAPGSAWQDILHPGGQGGYSVWGK